MLFCKKYTRGHEDFLIKLNTNIGVCFLPGNAIRKYRKHEHNIGDKITMNC